MADIDGGAGAASGAGTLTGGAGEVVTPTALSAVSARTVAEQIIARASDRLANDPAAHLRSWNSGSKGASGAAAIDELLAGVAALEKLDKIGTRRGPRQIQAVLYRRRGR